MSKTAIQVYDGRGNVLQLSDVLGRGGEGTVYSVAGEPGRVAKLYHKDGSDRADKLAAMVRLQSAPLLDIAAWPIDIVRRDARGPISGVLLPRINDYKDIHLLYTPKSRASEFPKTTWPFLIHAAGNVARAFAAMHARGHVIGDVNHGNVVISQEATARLIDCDSFQITTGAKHFLCEVGIDTHQPPELLARGSFRGILRTPNHDNFGLAVLVFQLLFMGRHPFAGRFLGTADMPIAKAIREYRFAYGKEAATRQMLPPPDTLSIQDIPPRIAGLFEQAFSPLTVQGAPRPNATAWVDAMKALASDLRACAYDSSHFFWKGLTTCPWCPIEQATGAVLFNLAIYASPTISRVDVNAVWIEIEAVQSPGPAPNLPAPRSLGLRPSQHARWMGFRRRGQLALGLVLGGFGFAEWAFGVPVRSLAEFWIFAIASGLGWMLARWGVGEARGLAEKAREEAKREWDATEARWLHTAGEGAFTEKVVQLSAARREILDLPAERQRRLQRLQAERRQREQHRFLDSFRIVAGCVRGIGPEREAMLQSFGIETAADVSDAAVMKVPGFGPVLAGELIRWRRTIERRFVFDQAKGVDPLDLAALDRDLNALRVRLEQTLRGGADQLRRISSEALLTRKTMLPQVEASLRKLAQAEADWSAS
jgi:DNA-binding helix-hairpin-helix protein with protein kinase domain